MRYIGRTELIDIGRELIAGLAQACRISEESLAALDLRVQLPNTPAWLYLPVVHHLPIDRKRSTIPIPSCHLCFWEHEREGTSPYWKAEWTLALASRCAKHLVCLFENCCHCVLGRLAVVAHPKHSGLVVRCTACFRAPAFKRGAGLQGEFPRSQLVASIGQALVLACRGLDPDPMWLGRVDATTFLSVVEDLIWIFMDGNLDGGFPLIDQCAPATDAEMVWIGRTPRQRPANSLKARHREIVVAAVAVALLGRRVIEQVDLGTRLPVPFSELDAYPFSSLAGWSIRDSRSEIVERIGRWPPILKERALRHLPLPD